MIEKVIERERERERELETVRGRKRESDEREREREREAESEGSFKTLPLCIVYHCSCKWMKVWLGVCVYVCECRHVYEVVNVCE